MNLRHRSRILRHLGSPRMFAALALLGGLMVTATTVSSEETSSTSPDSVPDPLTPTTARNHTSTTTAPTPTTAPPTTAPATTTPPVQPEPTIARIGDRGPAVVELQQRLAALGFWVPAVDGIYGAGTEQAVLAFQKHAGLGRDGVAGPATLAALDTADPVSAVEPGDHIEIDLARQLLIVVSGERTLAFNTSTGAPGWETPPGRFTITRQIDGMRHAPLGDLWRPKYFNGGIAIHGSPSIPGHAASHGCARLHDDAVDFLWEAGLAPVGTPVVVH